MAEWSKATVLKTVVSLVGTQGSNPCLSAIIVFGKVAEWLNAHPC